MADGAPRAADVSFDKPAAQKREGKVIKKAPAKPKSERDADAAKAKEAARVAAREKAAVCDLCGNQISVASRTCSMAWSFHAIDATALIPHSPRRCETSPTSCSGAAGRL